MGLMVVNHALAQHFYWLKLFQHDSLSALGAETTGQMVDLFAVGERGTRCL